MFDAVSHNLCLKCTVIIKLVVKFETNLTIIDLFEALGLRYI